ncbi:hypothetical protein FRC01_005559 [Tulasnella sp. 417]|nr:hypothetical protein FRC01_005559 [Tulasnella sp. 417]
MAARRRAKGEISALIPCLKYGTIGAGVMVFGENAEPMGIEEFDDAFEKVDSALQSHGTIANVSSSSLRQFRNTQRSPIYRLPLETLTTILIFTSGILSTSYKLFDMSTAPIIKTVLALAHVSSRWYNAVKACPILWTHIVADYAAPLVSMCLIRSGNLPLTVTCWGRGKQRRKEFMHELSKHIHRWETADLVLTFKDVRRITQYSAPQLKALAIVPVAVDDAEASLGAPEDLPMARQLFNGQTPQLEELKVDYWLKWQEANCPRLRKLEIALLIGRTPSVPDLNSMLSECPLLETLSIAAPIHRPDFAPGGPADIKLPHLKSIQIKGFTPLALSTFVFRLDLPQVENIHIEPDNSLIAAHEETDAIVLMVIMIAINPVLERLSSLATSADLLLDEDGVSFIFSGSRPQPGSPAEYKKINLYQFLWTDVMKLAIARCPSFVAKCEYLTVVGGGGEGCSSTTPQLIDLVTSLGALGIITLSGTPDSATLLSMFLDSGYRKRQLITHSGSWKRLMDVYLEGCLCSQEGEILDVLLTWKARRRMKWQSSEPWINLVNEGCRKCGKLRTKMKKIVDEGCAFSDPDSDSNSDSGPDSDSESEDEDEDKAPWNDEDGEAEGSV